MMQKALLYNLCKQIQDYVACVVIYGSFSANYPKHPTENSDIDFVVFYKNKANAPLFSKIIENTFEENELKYDYTWYYVEDFFSSLENKIDFFIWHNIFEYGEIVFAEPDFLNKAMSILRSTNPLATLSPTRKSRWEENQQHIKAIIRNLHRVMFDAVWSVYLLKKGTIPDFTRIISAAYREGVIDKDTLWTCQKVEDLREIIKTEDFNVSLSDLEKLKQKIDEFVDKVLILVNKKNNYGN